MKKKRLNFENDFEMLYLRHEYLRKAKELGKELDPNMIARYAGIVNTTAKIMFYKLRPNFQKVGFDEDDFVAITNLYMLSYMALYSIQTNPEEMDALVAKKGRLSEDEVLRIDRNRLISFLRQRLQHCSTLFARKARSITVGIDKRGIFAETSKSKPVQPDMLLENYKKYGYRKLTLKEFKEAQANAKLQGSSEIVDRNGFKVIKVEMLNQGLSEYDYKLISEDQSDSFYNPPDVILQKNEDDVALESNKIKFENLSQEERRKVVSVFLHRNYNDPSLKKEIEWAEKVLKQPVIEANLSLPVKEDKRKKKKDPSLEIIVV